MWLPPTSFCCQPPRGLQAGVKRWLKEVVYARLPLGWRAVAYFLYCYASRLGFLDGQAGAACHVLQGFWYRYLVDAKVAEVKRYMYEGPSRRCQNGNRAGVGYSRITRGLNRYQFIESLVAISTNGPQCKLRVGAPIVEGVRPSPSINRAIGYCNANDISLP